MDQNQLSIATQVVIPILSGELEGTFFSFNDPAMDEHIAIGLGPWRDNPCPLVRLHSECLTGDVFSSQRCDCGDQLNEAIARIYSAGGFLLYLRQEGRGIGLYNKLASYTLQDEGLDTFEANKSLGFDHDLRDYSEAAEMMKALGITSAVLLTNNPEKVESLKEHGIDIAGVRSTSSFVNPHNRSYLEAKARIAGHHIDI